MQFTKKIAFIVFFALSSQNVSAFHLSDHSAITRQALNEIQKCFPGLLTRPEQERMVKVNLSEDVNFVRKSAVYSHFYNPTKSLRMRRYDSMVRVDRIQDDVLARVPQVAISRRQEILDLLGYAIHHLQDMAVPVHVVPVMHSVFDGFEKFELGGELESKISCKELIDHGNTDLQKLLFETASQTLETVKSWNLNSQKIQGKDFWISSDDNQFGQYGPVGNNFGKTDFDFQGTAVHIDLETYRQFKRELAQLALKNTMRGVYWGLLLENPELFLPQTDFGLQKFLR